MLRNKCRSTMWFYCVDFAYRQIFGFIHPICLWLRFSTAFSQSSRSCYSKACYLSIWLSPLSAKRRKYLAVLTRMISCKQIPDCRISANIDEKVISSILHNRLLQCRKWPTDILQRQLRSMLYLTKRVVMLHHRAITSAGTGLVIKSSSPPKSTGWQKDDILALSWMPKITLASNQDTCCFHSLLVESFFKNLTQITPF